MRVVASVQAKRGSSRGLAHYLAHSKLDPEREPQSSRELFNAFTDDLSVKSANNSMRVGIAKGRPDNDELHHFVLSFRNDDYRKLGADEVRRRKALKEITRAAMRSLETVTHAERLLWAAAVHRNTGNPHVHIAIQKQYLSKEIDRQALTKIPREALPHYDICDSEKVLTNGYLIDAATDRMEAIIDRERYRDKGPKRLGKQAVLGEHHPDRASNREPVEGSDNRIAVEREILAKGILAEYELRHIETRIDSLLDHRDEMRFTVSDTVTGRKKRLSLREIEQRGPEKGLNEHDAPARQINTIFHKMLAKEEAAKDRIRREFGDAIRESKRIRGEYRKSDRRLLVPLLTKEELDQLQEQCLEASDIRRFSYLERIRTDLERSSEIGPRDKDDYRSILAQKNISELRSRLLERKHEEDSEKGYFRRFVIGEQSVSLADMDLEQKKAGTSVFSFFERLKNTAARFSGKRMPSTRGIEDDTLRTQIVEKLNQQLASVRKNSSAQQNKTKILVNILNANPEHRPDTASGSPEQLAEIETLAIRLKLKPEYEKNGRDQRVLIESAGIDCPAYRRHLKANSAADFREHKDHTIAGRVLAREIVSRVAFSKSKEGLKTFQDGRRFQKFAIADKKSGSISYLSLHDVDLSGRGSLLDRALEEVLEGREHRALRRTVASLVEDKERRLKDDVTAAREIMVSASRFASEFKETSFFGLKSEARFQPIFTSAEILMLEIRVENSRDPKEADRLRTILDSAADKPVRSLADILRDFETPEIASAKNREIGLVPEMNLVDSKSTEARPHEREMVGHRLKTRPFPDRVSQDHSR